MGRCILATGTASDPPPPEVQFNFSLVLYGMLCACVCVVHSDARAVSRVLKPLRLAGVADMTSSHNGGFILPTVKRLQGFQGVLTRLRRPSEPTPCLRLTNLRRSKSVARAPAVRHLYLVHFIIFATH